MKQLESSLKEVEKGLIAEQKYDQAGGYVNFTQQEDTLRVTHSERVYLFLAFTLFFSIDLCAKIPKAQKILH